MIPHLPIMVQPILVGLQVAEKANAHWFDGTLGAGGHSHAILSQRSDSRLSACDLDPEALALAQNRLAEFGERVQIHHASYEDVLPKLSQLDGILLDFGVSSMQLDRPERGFAFRFDSPLDMRFDPTSQRPTAAELVNSASEQELAEIIFRYGEDRYSRQIARQIVQNRPITHTRQLAELIAQNTPLHKQLGMHPATRTFQALRIAVNDELGAVERVLPHALRALKIGGRLAVITFHSLEDRIVKDFFRQAATDCLCPPRQPICTCGHLAEAEILTRKPISADETEVTYNPRARSAKLRLIEKMR